MKHFQLTAVISDNKARRNKNIKDNQETQSRRFNRQVKPAMLCRPHGLSLWFTVKFSSARLDEQLAKQKKLNCSDGRQRGSIKVSAKTICVQSPDVLYCWEIVVKPISRTCQWWLTSFISLAYIDFTCIWRVLAAYFGPWQFMSESTWKHVNTISNGRTTWMRRSINPNWSACQSSCYSGEVLTKTVWGNVIN